MLKKHQRFHGHNSLRRVYSSGASAYSRPYKVLCLTKTGGSSRAAVVVSKKVHKSAVVRNRIRRRLYEQLSSLLAGELALDIVVVVNDPIVATCPSATLTEEFAALVATGAEQARRRGVPRAVHGGYHKKPSDRARN